MQRQLDEQAARDKTATQMEVDGGGGGEKGRESEVDKIMTKYEAWCAK